MPLNPRAIYPPMQALIHSSGHTERENDSDEDRRAHDTRRGMKLSAKACAARRVEIKNFDLTDDIPSGSEK